MMIITVLKRLEQSGDLRVLAKAGLLSPKVYTYKDVYSNYEENLKSCESRMEALHKTCIEMKVGESMIYRAKKMMEG